MRGAKWKIAQSNWNRSSRPREGRGSASSRTNSGFVQRNIYPGCSHLSRALPSGPRQQPTHQGKPSEAAAARRTCQPNDIIRRSFLGPRHSHSSSHPRFARAVSASARVARAFVIPTPPAIREQLPLRPSCLFAPATALFSSSPCFRDTKAPTRSTRFRI